MRTEPPINAVSSSPIQDNERSGAAFWRPLDFCPFAVLYFQATGAISLSKRRSRRSFGKGHCRSLNKKMEAARLFMRAA